MKKARKKQSKGLLVFEGRLSHDDGDDEYEDLDVEEYARDEGNWEWRKVGHRRIRADAERLVEEHAGTGSPVEEKRYMVINLDTKKVQMYRTVFTRSIVDD